MVTGEQVRLRAGSALRIKHPELVDAVGVVSSTTLSGNETLLHVCFQPPVNLVVMNVEASEFEGLGEDTPLRNVS